MPIKQLLTGILLILFLASADAQENAQREAGHYIITGMGMSGYNSLARGWTPLRYTGASYLQTLGYRHISEGRRIQEVQLGGMFGLMSPAEEVPYNDPGATLITGDINYTICWPLAQLAREMPLQLGGGFHSLSVMKSHENYGNSAFNYEFVNSLALSAATERPFTIWGQSFIAGFSLSLPVYSIVVAPSYNYAAPVGFTEEEGFLAAFGQSLKGQSFEDLFRLRTGLGLDWLFDNGNILRLQYDWDYFDYYYIPDNRVQTAFHMISVNTLFKL